MKKRHLQAGILLAAIIFTGTGCLDIIQFNLFQALEKPNLSADHLNTLTQAEILETAETLNDSGDADTYTDEEIDNLTNELDQILDSAPPNDVAQAVSGFAGNIVLTAGGGNDVINNFVGVIPALQAAGASADMQVLITALVSSFGENIGQAEFLEKMHSILDAAVYYSDLAGYITDNSGIITASLNAGEIAQFGAVALILRDAIIFEDDIQLISLYTALYSGDDATLNTLINQSAFDFDNSLDPDATTILNATGFMSLIQG